MGSEYRSRGKSRDLFGSALRLLGSLMRPTRVYFSPRMDHDKRSGSSLVIRLGLGFDATMSRKFF